MNVLISIKDAQHLETMLAMLAPKAVPHAVRDTLNETAFTVRKEWISLIEAKFILRNKYTVKSIRVAKASGTDLSTMQAVVGSAADYMDEQEEGATRVKKGKHGVAIPTPTAAGQGARANPRKRPIRRPNYLGAIHPTSSKVGPKFQRNAVAIALAIRKGTRVAYLETKETKGLFQVTGTERRPKVRMLYDLQHASVKIPKAPTLGPSLREVDRLAPAIAHKAFTKQFDRALAKVKG